VSTSSTHNESAPKKEFAPEFASWPMDDKQVDILNTVRNEFDQLLEKITFRIAPGNGRYLAIVKTKLEEACMFATKGIAKPTTN